MSKLQLILSDSVQVSFAAQWIADLMQDYFDIQFIEHDPHITSRAIFVTDYLRDNQWYMKHIRDGHKVLVDGLWEISNNLPDKFVISNKNWFWYNESLWYRYLGYHNYTPDPEIQKTGLLLMNIQKNHRDWLFDRLNLNRLLYSYVGRGIFISDDIEQDNHLWQRYFNPTWYNSTAFSIVAETTVWRDDPLFITEKSFKPIAFQHPFIIFGQPKLLQHLKKLGFETFENIFDESYDGEYELDIRLNKIVDQINNYEHTNADLLTIEKLQHNKELFFNEQVVKDRIIKEIVEPIIEYAET